MATLDEAKKEMLAVLTKLEESGGEITEELAPIFEAAELQIKTKADAYVFIIERLNQLAQWYKGRATEYGFVAKRLISSAVFMENKIKETMRSLDLKEVVGIESKVRLSPTRGAVEIIDEKILPSKFFDEELVRTPNKDRIRKALESGEPVPGVQLKQNWSLRMGINSK